MKAKYSPKEYLHDLSVLDEVKIDLQNLDTIPFEYEDGQDPIQETRLMGMRDSILDLLDRLYVELEHYKQLI